MRNMTNGRGVNVNVIEHIMLSNSWEYYILEEAGDSTDGIAFALVVGHETELGYVSMNEIEPYITSRTKCLDNIMPAPKWSWCTNPTFLNSINQDPQSGQYRWDAHAGLS